MTGASSTATGGQSRTLVKRALLIVNRSSATGYDEAVTARLHAVLVDALDRGIDVQARVVSEHAQARELAAAFMAASEAPALIIVGGGGGTLRAVVEGVCQGTEPGNLPAPERMRIAALRMGSGNVVAKQFGVPHDSETALRSIIANLQAGRTTTCCIMRCEVGQKGSLPQICFAVAMAGFGQFGRSPGDLLRWRQRHPALRRFMAKILTIERVNTLEYCLSFALRLLRSALWPGVCEVVEIRSGERTESVRLLSGVIMNFPIKQVPFEPGVRIEDAALSFLVVPHPGRRQALCGLFAIKLLSSKATRIRIEGSDRAEVRLLDRDEAEFFLDEDPALFYRTVKIGVAGRLAFVPGPDYRWPQERGNSP